MDLPIALKNLDILSIGNNKFEREEPITKYLRNFKKLQVLNVAGNPFTEDTNSDYEKNIVIGLSPQLKYLNYEFIDDELRK